MSGIKTITENDFRDHLVLQIIESYGKLQRNEPSLGRPPRAPERMKHGSCIYPLSERSRCQYCRIKGVQNWTQRKCPDCDFQPALCQVQERDCHSEWHKPAFDEQRSCWLHSKKTEVEVQLHAPNTRSNSIRSTEQDEAETDAQSRNEDIGNPTVGRNQDESQGKLAESSLEQDEPSLPDQVSPNGEPSVQEQGDPAGSTELQFVRSEEQCKPNRGRPKGSINKRRRRGCYKHRL